MSPPSALIGRMRIAGQIGLLMMDPMNGHPRDRPAFERERPADRKEILKTSGHFVRAVRVQPVITHADTQPCGHPIKKDRGPENLPAEKKQRGDRPQMEQDHDAGNGPVGLLLVEHVDFGLPLLLWRLVHHAISDLRTDL